MRRLTLSGMCAAIVASAVVVSPAGASRSGELPRICAEEEVAAQQWGVDLGRLAGDGVISIDGRMLALSVPAAWRMWDEDDPAFATFFHSAAWLVPGIMQGAPVVDLLLERDEVVPDPGFVSGAASLRETGWTTGTVRLRMNTVACLFSATRDPRLEAVMERLVAANLDPYRYRGAPLNKTHNQGTRANVALLEAARVFDRPEWREPAVRRFEADSGSIFDECGMSAEQSTTYHRLNVNLWRRSLGQLGAELGGVVDMGDVVYRAARATWQLTRPDGILEAVGNGKPVRVAAEDLGLTADTGMPTHLLCPTLGWAANRSSWDDTATHYVLRFGPRPTAHGHEDRGALTWFAQGVPVFSDRGVFDRARGERWRWAQSAAAHSTFHGVGTSWPRPFRADHASVDGADVYRVSSSYRNDRLERVITLPLATDDTESSLRVSDEASTTRARQWFQHWQLDATWTPLPRTTAWEPAAVHEGSGLYLYGACWSGIYMRLSVARVESYPAWRSAVPAYALECGGLDRTVRMETLWVVSPVEGLLSWDVRTGEHTVSPPVPDPVPDPAP